jgi:hypothetical protein
VAVVLPKKAIDSDESELDGSEPDAELVDIFNNLNGEATAPKRQKRRMAEGEVAGGFGGDVVAPRARVNSGVAAASASSSSGPSAFQLPSAAVASVSSSSSDVLSGPVVEASPGNAGGCAGASGVVVAPPPPVAHPVPRPEDLANGGGRGRGAAWDRNSYFNEAGVQLGFFVLNPKTNSIAAHCLQHGNGCRIQKVARFAPLGYLGAWLEAGSEFQDPETGMRDHIGHKETIGQLGSFFSSATV